MAQPTFNERALVRTALGLDRWLAISPADAHARALPCEVVEADRPESLAGMIRARRRMDLLLLGATFGDPAGADDRPSIEILSRIRRSPVPDVRLLPVLVTMYAPTPARTAAFGAAGADAIVAQPYAARTLQARIRAALTRTHRAPARPPRVLVSAS